MGSHLLLAETHARLGGIIADADRCLASLRARERLARRLARARR